MKKIYLFVLLLILTIFVLPPFAYADCYSDCIGRGNTPSECQAACPTTEGLFGSIKNPIDMGCGIIPGCGLIVLLNNILRLIFVVAGIYTMIRILTAGFKFISAGANPEKMSEAQSSIWQSLVGLIIIISSIAIAGLIGLLLFGAWDAILNPKIYGPQ